MRTALRRLFRLTNPPVQPMSAEPRERGSGRRFRIMMRHTGFVITALVLLLGGLGAMTYVLLNQPTELTIAVGPPNSEDTRVVQSIAAQLARDQANVRLQTKVLDGGPPAAAAAIDNGQADLAVVRRDAGMPKTGQVIAILRKNIVVFIVPSAADPPRTARGRAVAKAKPIEKIEQMVGKRLGVVGRSPRNIDLLKVILRQYRINPDQIVMLGADDLAKPNAAGKISIVQYDPNNVASAIKDSNADVIMSVGPVGSPITADAVAAATRGKEAPTFLAIDASEAIAARDPAYESDEIKAGAFGGSPQRPEESVETIAVNHYIVARKSLSEQVAADFTKQLFLIRQNLANDLPAAAKIEKPDTDKDASVPVHPGAAAYLDGDLKTFFDRYSDLLYWGLMAMSLLGSAFAGILSYGKADDRVRKLRTLEKLLEIAKSARTADSPQALDQLQGEIDDIQAGMIRDVEASSIDETAMVAYAMSVERAQMAISDRRRSVSDQPARPLAAVASL